MDPTPGRGEALPDLRLPKWNNVFRQNKSGSSSSPRSPSAPVTIEYKAAGVRRVVGSPRSPGVAGASPPTASPPSQSPRRRPAGQRVSVYSVEAGYDGKRPQRSTGPRAVDPRDALVPDGFGGAVKARDVHPSIREIVRRRPLDPRAVARRLAPIVAGEEPPVPDVAPLSGNIVDGKVEFLEGPDTGLEKHRPGSDHGNESDYYTSEEEGEGDEGGGAGKGTSSSSKVSDPQAGSTASQPATNGDAVNGGNGGNVGTDGTDGTADTETTTTTTTTTTKPKTQPETLLQSQSQPPSNVDTDQQPNVEPITASDNDGGDESDASSQSSPSSSSSSSSSSSISVASSYESGGGGAGSAPVEGITPTGDFAHDAKVWAHGGKPRAKRIAAPTLYTSADEFVPSPRRPAPGVRRPRETSEQRSDRTAREDGSDSASNQRRNATATTGDPRSASGSVNVNVSVNASADRNNSSSDSDDSIYLPSRAYQPRRGRSQGQQQRRRRRRRVWKPTLDHEVLPDGSLRMPLVPLRIESLIPHRDRIVESFPVVPPPDHMSPRREPAESAVYTERIGNRGRDNTNTNTNANTHANTHANASASASGGSYITQRGKGKARSGGGGGGGGTGGRVPHGEWTRPMFPSANPDSRRDAKFLRMWTDDMLSRCDERHPFRSADGMLKDAASGEKDEEKSVSDGGGDGGGDGDGSNQEGGEVADDAGDGSDREGGKVADAVDAGGDAPPTSAPQGANAAEGKSETKPERKKDSLVQGRANEKGNGNNNPNSGSTSKPTVKAADLCDTVLADDAEVRWRNSVREVCHIAFNEVARQVTAGCRDRGSVLVTLWTTMMRVFDPETPLQREVAAVRALKRENASLHAQLDTMRAALADAEAGRGDGLELRNARAAFEAKIRAMAAECDERVADYQTVLDEREQFKCEAEESERAMHDAHRERDACKQRMHALETQLLMMRSVASTLEHVESQVREFNDKWDRVTPGVTYLDGLDNRPEYDAFMQSVTVVESFVQEGIRIREDIYRRLGRHSGIGDEHERPRVNFNVRDVAAQTDFLERQQVVVREVPVKAPTPEPQAETPRRRRKKKGRGHGKSLSHLIPTMGRFIKNIKGKGRLRSLRWVLRVLHMIYLEKVFHDTIADRDARDRVPLPEFVYTFTQTKYGLRHLAEQNLLDLVISVDHYAGYEECHAVKTFVFLLDESEVCPQYLDVYLRFVDAMRTWSTGRPQDQYLHTDDRGNRYLPYSKALDLARANLLLSGDRMARVSAKFARMQMRPPPTFPALSLGRDTTVVDADAFLSASLREFRNIRSNFPNLVAPIVSACYPKKAAKMASEGLDYSTSRSRSKNSLTSFGAAGIAASTPALLAGEQPSQHGSLITSSLRIMSVAHGVSSPSLAPVGTRDSNRDLLGGGGDGRRRGIMGVGGGEAELRARIEKLAAETAVSGDRQGSDGDGGGNDGGDGDDGENDDSGNALPIVNVGIDEDATSGRLSPGALAATCGSAQRSTASLDTASETASANPNDSTSDVKSNTHGGGRNGSHEKTPGAKGGGNGNGNGNGQPTAAVSHTLSVPSLSADMQYACRACGAQHGSTSILPHMAQCAPRVKAAARVADLRPAVGVHIETVATTSGTSAVVCVASDPRGPAFRAGILPGSLLVSVSIEDRSDGSLASSSSYDRLTRRVGGRGDHNDDGSAAAADDDDDAPLYGDDGDEGIGVQRPPGRRRNKPITASNTSGSDSGGGGRGGGSPAQTDDGEIPIVTAEGFRDAVRRVRPGGSILVTFVPPGGADTDKVQRQVVVGAAGLRPEELEALLDMASQDPLPAGRVPVRAPSDDGRV